MRLVLFVLFILQMAACKPSKQEIILSYDLPEITIYAKRIPGAPMAKQPTAAMSDYDAMNQTFNSRVTTP